jgi:hypothetical protein
MNVTLSDGRKAKKAAVDEIFGRIVSAGGRWPGLRAIEELAQVAVGCQGPSQILSSQPGSSRSS